MSEVLALLVAVLCALINGALAGAEKSESFDLKPTGQVSHQTIQLVR